MTTYTFKVVIEPDDNRRYAYCPALVERGGSTWGATPEEALANLETVVKMVVASLAGFPGRRCDPAKDRSNMRTQTTRFSIGCHESSAR